MVCRQFPTFESRGEGCREGAIESMFSSLLSRFGSRSLSPDSNGESRRRSPGSERGGRLSGSYGGGPEERLDPEELELVRRYDPPPFAASMT